MAVTVFVVVVAFSEGPALKGEDLELGSNALAGVTRRTEAMKSEGSARLMLEPYCRLFPETLVLLRREERRTYCCR